MQKACSEEQVLRHLQTQIHGWCKSGQLHPVQKAALIYTPCLIAEIRPETRALTLSVMHFAVIHNDFTIHDDFLLPTMHIIYIYYIKLEVIIY